MTQPSDFKAAVSSLLANFADALNALSDELVDALGPATSSGSVSPGTVSAPAALSTDVFSTTPSAETVESGQPTDLNPDGSPRPVEVVVDPASVSVPTTGTTVSMGATPADPSISTSTVGSPVTTSDATPPL